MARLLGSLLRALPALALLAALSACTGAGDYWRTERWGEGWRLEVTEKQGARFTAKWVKGENRSVELLNYDDSRGRANMVNTLYLELDASGSVVAGRLKRFLVTDFTPADDKGAAWFRVLGGICRLDDRGAGTLDVTCEQGYAFKGEVIPSDNLKKITPEQP